MRSAGRGTAAAAAGLFLSIPLGVAPAQETAPPRSPEPPKPSVHHGRLRALLGTWDAEAQVPGSPGAPPSRFKGVETNTLDCGGLWLVQEFQGEMMGRPFRGRGLMGYDLARKKYVAVWVDNWLTGLTTFAGTCDEEGKKFTLEGEGPDPAGKTIKQKSVIEVEDPETHTMTLTFVAPDGSETSMEVTYRRRGPSDPGEWLRDRVKERREVADQEAEEESRRAEERAADEARRKLAETEAKAKARPERETPWKKALEKIVPAAKRRLTSDDRWKAHFGAWGFEDKKDPTAPVYRITVREPFLELRRLEREAIMREMIAFFADLEAEHFSARAGEIRFAWFRLEEPEEEAAPARKKRLIAESVGVAIEWK
ncbi:MAG: DUF1579 domain-containing protein [Planctomycetales bacterium]|nr:DUF1579 domain-containing protein [Planctomycetales bacterium]